MADLVFLDRDYCHYSPLWAPMEQLVFSENGAAVREVMIGGRFVLKDGRLLTLNEPALRRADQAAAERLDHANAPARHVAAVAHAIVRSFCLGQCNSA